MSWKQKLYLWLTLRAETRTELIVKMILYSALYGLLHINYIDLVVPGSQIPGYHLWLVITYFAPFIPLLFIYGFKDWELVLSLGLIASLMNDLFYYPIAMIMFGRHVDLLEWYSFQLGLQGFKVRWYFNGGFFTFPVTSILMAISIYLRIVLVTLLLWKWWRED